MYIYATHVFARAHLLLKKATSDLMSQNSGSQVPSFPPYVSLQMVVLWCSPAIMNTLAAECKQLLQVSVLFV